MSMKMETVSGDERFANLANETVDFIVAAVQGHNLELDEAVCVIVTVCADLAKGQYGVEYLAGLAQVVLESPGRNEPEEIKS